MTYDKYGRLIPKCGRGLVDRYTEEHILVWMHLLPTPCSNLSLEKLSCPEIGVVPSWFECEDPVSVVSDEIESAHRYLTAEFSYANSDFALREGIAPRQPFLVQIYPPKVVGSDYFDEDCDVEWTWKVVAKKPLSNKRALRRWEKLLEHQRRKRLRSEYERTYRRKQAERRADAFMLQVERWPYHPDYRSHLSFTLYSKFGFFHITGTSDLGEEDAMRKLIDHALKVVPCLSPELIREMYRTSYRVDR